MDGARADRPVAGGKDAAPRKAGGLRPFRVRSFAGAAGLMFVAALSMYCSCCRCTISPELL